MIYGAKVCVVLPAFNAARTLARTLEGLDRASIDEIIVVDDASTDETREITRRLGVRYALTYAKDGSLTQPTWSAKGIPFLKNMSAKHSERYFHDVPAGLSWQHSPAASTAFSRLSMLPPVVTMKLVAVALLVEPKRFATVTK